MLELNHSPFPHCVLEGYWDKSALDLARGAVDWIQDPSWKRVHVATQAGEVLESKDSINFDRCKELLPEVWQMRDRLASPGFIKELEEATRIPYLQFDPKGGGIHRIRPGGCLGMHVDFNVSNDGCWRRVNVLVYLGGCAGGGELVLMSEDTGHQVVIKPEMNRTVIFECSEHSWHGHPVPLSDGPDRLSLAAYYFTREPPPQHSEPHDTIFRTADGRRVVFTAKDANGKT